MKLHIIYPLVMVFIVVMAFMLKILLSEGIQDQKCQTKCIEGYSFIIDQRGVHQIIDMSGNGLPCIKD